MNESFLADVVRTLEPGGRLHFWTDVKDYFDAALALIAEVTPLVGPLAVSEKSAEHDLDFRTHFERRTRLHGGMRRPLIACAFCLLLGSLRRASRSLLVWVLLAGVMTWLGDDSTLPRGLGLLLPPLALCAAVGLQSPVRWLGALGGVITTCALAGVVVVNIEGGAVLHRSDTIKILTQSQQHAPPGALLCTVGIRPEVSTFYAHRPIAQFDSVEQLAQALAPGQLFSCLLPLSLLEEVQQRLAPPVITPARPPEPPARPGRRPTGPTTKELAKELRDAVAKSREAKDEPPEGIGSVLESKLDIETPPLDTQGPKVVLVSR